MLLVINFIDFFSRSEWIDILSGMMIPFVLLIISFFIQNKQIKKQTRITEEQFKEQTRITESQFKEQIKITKEQFKEQNELAEKQIKKQNELSVNKEKRMLSTQLRLSKYEEFYSLVTEYIENSKPLFRLAFDGYFYEADTSDLNKIIYKSYEIDKNQVILYNKINVISSFCPEFKNSWFSLYKAYGCLDLFISSNITNKRKEKEEEYCGLSEKEIEDLITKTYNAHTKDLGAIQEKCNFNSSTIITLINESIFEILSDLEKVL